jgi:hypothetical protein
MSRAVVSILVGLSLAACKAPPEPPALPPPLSLVDAVERALPGLPDPVTRARVLLGLAEAELAADPALAVARLTAAGVALQGIPESSLQDDLRTRLVQLWCKVGQVPQARHIAARVPDPELKAETQVFLTEALVAAGRLAEADTEARGVAVAAQRGRALLAVVRGHLAAGALAEAGRRVAGLSGLPERDEALSEVAVAYGRAGQAREVTAALNDIQSPHWRGVAQVALAEALMRSGQRARARSAVDGIESGWLRARGLVRLSALERGPAAAQLLERARAEAADLSDPLMRSSARADLVMQLVESGREADGAALLAQIEDPGTRRQTAAQLVRRYAEAGRLEDAEAALPGVEEDALWRGDALRDLAVARARAGQAEAALRMVDRIRAPGSRWSALGQVAATAPAAPDPQVLAALAAVLAGPGS